MLNPKMQEDTINLMLHNKKHVTIKETLRAFDAISNTLRPTKAYMSALSLKYRVRLHVKQFVA